MFPAPPPHRLTERDPSGLRLTGWIALLLGAASPAPAAELLPPFIHTATRGTADRLAFGGTTEVLSAEDLARQQRSTLASAVSAIAGAPAAAAGGPGALTSVFLRGANSNQTLFLVDGLRLNDPNTDYAVFLGGACLGACDSLEIAHGPQSTLYGGEAVGGVIALRTGRGQGPASTRLAMEAGSFGTWQGAVSSQGSRGTDAWSLSLQGGRTRNDRPNNAFASGNLVARVDRRIHPGLEAGATVRGFRGDYGSPGDRFTNDPDNRERENNVLATAFAEWSGAPWRTRLLLGGQDRRFVAASPAPPRPTAVTRVTNRRGVLDLQGAFSGWARHRVTGGTNLEANHTRNTGFGNINRRQRLAAVFVQDEFAVGPGLDLILGLRDDDFDTFGRATTGRAAASWRPRGGGLRLRASHGTGFRAPSFLDLFGESAFYRGNPRLRPERARGWEAGLDWEHAGGPWYLGVTFFELGLKDLIASTRDFRSVENIQRARTTGWELRGGARLGARGLLAGHYTLMEADNLTSQRRLLRRPRHRGGVDLWGELAQGLSAGGGVAVVAGREDVHARTFRTVSGEDYTVVRLHAEQRLGRDWSVRARIENALDERHEQVHGYPAPGRGLYLAWERRL